MSRLLVISYESYSNCKNCDGKVTQCAVFCDISNDARYFVLYAGYSHLLCGYYWHIIVCWALPLVLWVLLAHHIVCWVLRHLLLGTAGTSLRANYGHLLCWDDAAVCCVLMCNFHTYIWHTVCQYCYNLFRAAISAAQLACKKLLIALAEFGGKIGHSKNCLKSSVKSGSLHSAQI